MKASSEIRVTRETHDTPAGISEQLLVAGGTNLYGEANFRVVWGGSRLTWMGGRWTDRDENGKVIRETIETRRVPKYLPVERWHIERWMPAESYGSPEQWEAQTTEVEDGIRILALGPYPARGEYEHCFTLASAQGEFLPLSPAACDWIVRAVAWAKRQPRREQGGAISAREAQRERRGAIGIGIVTRTTCPAFHGAPFVGVAVCRHCSAILDEGKAAKHGLGAGAAAARATRLNANGAPSTEKKSRA